LGNIDPSKLAKAVLVSFLSAMPLVVWVFLGGTGRLGDYADTQGFQNVTIGLFIVTAIWYVGVVPFLIWPRIFTGPDASDEILRTGIPARGELVGLGLRGIDGVMWRKRRNTYHTMAVKVTLARETYTLENHVALVPEQILPFLREGMEFPVQVSEADRNKITIDWEPLLKHYPENPGAGEVSPW
jgi:hypothetical protein